MLRSWYFRSYNNSIRSPVGDFAYKSYILMAKWFKCAKWRHKNDQNEIKKFAFAPPIWELLCSCFDFRLSRFELLTCDFFLKLTETIPCRISTFEFNLQKKCTINGKYPWKRDVDAIPTHFTLFWELIDFCQLAMSVTHIVTPILCSVFEKGNKSQMSIAHPEKK